MRLCRNNLYRRPFAVITTLTNRVDVRGTILFANVHPDVIRATNGKVGVGLIAIRLVRFRGAARRGNNRPRVALLRRVGQFSLSKNRFRRRVVVADDDGHLHVLRVLPVANGLVRRDDQLRRLATIVNGFNASCLAIRARIIRMGTIYYILRYYFDPLMRALPFLGVKTILHDLRGFRNGSKAENIKADIL